MALSDSSVIDRLTELFEDSWNNLYSPLTLENTVVSDHLTDELRAEIEDLKQREHANEERIGAVDKQTKYKLLNIESQIEDISTNFSRAIGDVSANFAKKLGDVSANINSTISDISTNLSKTIGDVSTNLSKTIGDVSTHLNDRITTDVSVLRSDMLAAIDELDASLLSVIDDTSALINKHVKEEIDKIDATLETHRARIASLEKSREDVDNLLGNILQWEDQDGSIL